MGSHPLVDNSKNGWLATLGCCAPKTYYNHEDEEDEVGLQARKSLEAGTLIFDQPRAIKPLMIEQEYTRPLTSYSMGQALSSWVETGRDIALRASTRASTTIRVRTWAGHPRNRPNISISAPTDFRRLDERDAMPPVRRNPSFRRLELSIYLPENRLSPLPDFNASGWDQKPTNLESPKPALLRSRSPTLPSPPTTTNFIIQRKPVRSSIDGSTSSASHSRSSSRLSMGAPSIDVSRPPSIPWVDPLSSHPPTPPAHQINHSTTSLDHPSTFLPLPTPPRPVSRINSPSPTPSYRSRAMTEPTRGRSTPSPTPLPPIPQKRPSVRRPTNSVDEAIRELNTIVEERRAADAYRSSANSLASGVMPISPTHHVPAIAPSLRMHVRSETLSDIGSAFSVPLASSKPLPSAPSTPFTPMAPGEKRPLILAKPLDMPHVVPEVEEHYYVADDPYPRPSTAGSMLTLASTKSRISLWLRRRNRSQNDDLQMPTPLPTSPASAEEIQPFYRCTTTPTPRAHAQHSSISSVSTYETTPSLSGRTDTTITSVVSPTSPDTPPSRRSRSWRPTNSGATVTGCAHESLPPMSHHAVDESHLISPLTPTKVGLAF